MFIGKYKNRWEPWLKEVKVLGWLPLLWFFHGSIWLCEPSGYKTFFNWGSVVLEITGGGIVLWQLNDMVEEFRSSSIIQGAWEWIKRCPAWRKPKHYTVQADSGVISMTCSMVGSVTVGEHTLEQKVAYLMTEVKRLDTRISDTKQGLSKEITEVKHEQATLSQKVSDVESGLQSALIGDVHVEVFGALLIVQGVIMGAMA